MIKRKYAGYVWYILFVFLISLSACGKEDRQRGINGYVYEAEQLSGTEEWRGTYKCYGNWLYYMGSSKSLRRIPLREDGRPEGTSKAVVRSIEEILDYTVDAEGRIYCYSATADYSNAQGVEVKGGTLTRYHEDGSVDYTFSLEDRQTTYKYLHDTEGYLAVGRDGRVFLLIGDLVLVVDEEGELVSEIDISGIRSDVEMLLEGEDGRVYCLVLAEHSNLYELAQEGDSYRPQILSMNGMEGRQDLTFGYFYSSPGGILYSGTDGVLYRYSADKDSWQQLLRWNDSNLSRKMDRLIWLSEGKLLVGYIQQNEIYLLSRKRVDELPEREELILTCWDTCPSELEDAIIHFNRDSEQYHVTIQLYEEDAWLDTRLVSSNPPDMMYLRSWDVEKYATKQALEDLSPYLEKSSRLKKEDFLENILKAYTINERLVGIPSDFLCTTLRGYPSEVGSQAGWTLRDVMALTEKYPGRKLNNRSFRWNLENLCGNYIMDTFIDKENRTCRFDTEEFRCFVQWLGEHSGSLTDLNYVLETANPLTATTNVRNIQEFLMYVSRPEEGTISIGWPSPDGSPRYKGSAFHAVGILSKSPHKEGAWQFIEYFLSLEKYDTMRSISTQMPARRDLLEAILEDALAPDMKGSNTLSQDPTAPQMYPKWTAMGYTDMEGSFVPSELVYYYATQDEVDSLLEMISQADFSLTSALETNVMDVIAEEAVYYFDGSKSLEEVTRIIQNRVNTIVQEN